MSKIKIFVCEHVMKVYEENYGSAQIKKSQNVICDCDIGRFVVFTMCSFCKTLVENIEIGLSK